MLREANRADVSGRSPAGFDVGTLEGGRTAGGGGGGGPPAAGGGGGAPPAGAAVRSVPWLIKS